jgi:hypothetical protein
MRLAAVLCMLAGWGLITLFEKIKKD